MEIKILHSHSQKNETREAKLQQRIQIYGTEQVWKLNFFKKKKSKPCLKKTMFEMKEELKEKTDWINMITKVIQHSEIQGKLS